MTEFRAARELKFQQIPRAKLGALFKNIAELKEVPRTQLMDCGFFCVRVKREREERGTRFTDVCIFQENIRKRV